MNSTKTGRTDTSKPNVSNPPRKAAKKTAKGAEPSTLSYPSPLLGIPASASSYEIDRAAGGRLRQLDINVTAAVDKARREARAKVAPHAATERDEIAGVRRNHRTHVDEANATYDRAVREAQSVRDRAIYAANEARDSALALVSGDFSKAAAEIERALKAEEFQIAELAKTDREAATREAEAYKAPVLKAEAERRQARKIERDAIEAAKKAAAARADVAARESAKGEIVARLVSRESKKTAKPIVGAAS
jgi:colicin import membrane protein